jgi:membrane protease YdiL (CAAX protease family)
MPTPHPHTPATPTPQPIPLWQTALFFGVPGVLIYLATYYLVPLMLAAGVPLIWAWTLAIFVPYQPLALALVVRHLAQPGNTWRTFARRFRFVPIPRREWTWMLLAFPLMVGLGLALEWTVPLLAQIFPPAPAAPALFANPQASVREGGAATFFGVPMAGNVWLLGFWLVWGIVGVLGEEIIWRGYLLPRMEQTHGRAAWLINGLLWNGLFHLYTLYNLFTDLPFMLLIPFLAQRTQSTWTAVILHLALLWLAFAILLPGVFGG